MNKSTEMMGARTERAIQKIRSQWKNEIDEGALSDTVEVANKKATKLFEKQRKAIAELGKQFSQSFITGSDGMGGAASAVSRVMSGVTRKFPVSGIIGMMLFGRMREEENRVRVERLAQTFQNAGEVGMNQVRGLQGELRALEDIMPGISQEFAATATAFSSMGVTARQAMAETGNNIAGVRDTALSLSVALDDTFEVAGGTVGRFAAQVSMDANGSLTATLNTIRDIGLATKDTGISFTQMSGAIMQATGSLRLQMHSQEELLGVAEAIRDAQSGFEAQGMGGRAAGQLAASGIAGVAGAISGLSEGLKAVMGQRMSGGEVQGLDAVLQFERGMGQMSQGNFFGGAMKQILAMSREIGGGEESAQYKVLKELFGMNAEQAQAMLAVQRAADEEGDISKASKKHLETLENAFVDKSLKTDTFERLMNRLITAVAKLGAGIADILLSSLESVSLYLQWFVDYLSGVNVRSTEYQTTYYAYRDALAMSTGRGVESVIGAMGDIVSVAGDTLNFAFQDTQKARDAFREAQKEATTQKNPPNPTGGKGMPTAPMGTVGNFSSDAFEALNFQNKSRKVRATVTLEDEKTLRTTTEPASG